MSEFYTGDESTPFLHGIADDLGCGANDLRHALGIIVASALTRPTKDENTDFVKSDLSTASNYFTLDAVGGTEPSRAVHLPVAQYGMYLIAEDDDDVPCCGINYAVAGDAADDDAIIRVSIAGILPDGEPLIKSLQGRGVIRLPHRAIAADLILTFSNISTTTKATISLNAFSKRAKSEVAAAGRASLMDKGVPVGKAKAWVSGMVANAIDANEETKSQFGAHMRAAVASKDPGRVNTVRSAARDAQKAAVGKVGRAGLSNADKVKDWVGDNAGAITGGILGGPIGAAVGGWASKAYGKLRRGGSGGKRR